MEIKDVAGDGDFPELQGYFPRRDTGMLYAHFALMMADPSEQLNIALAGPGWFSLRKDGIALWLQTRGGTLYHYSDSIPKRLVALRAFAWYLVDVAYDVAAGTYDLAIHEEGRSEPLVSLAGQPNAASQPGSAVDKFSFIGDNGHDTSNVDYYVDDILLTVDRPIDLAPLVAPGRRKLFFDVWNDGARMLRARPACLPPIDFADFGLSEETLAGLKRDGLLPLLEAMIERRQGLAAGESPPVIEAIRLWSAGCAALARNDGAAALERFEAAARQAPAGRIYALSAVLALAALGRWDEVDVRLASAYAGWRDDPRLPLALATIGLARGDLEAAEQPLRSPAGSVPDDPRSECALVASSGRLDTALIQMLKARFPDDWATCLDAALLPEEYYYVLLWKKAYPDAERYATRMAERLKGFGLPAAGWIERIGDAAFAAGNHAGALRRYEEALRAEGDADESPGGGAGARSGILLKLSDVHFLLGDVEKERSYREAIYGSLHEESEHRALARGEGR